MEEKEKRHDPYRFELILNNSLQQMEATKGGKFDAFKRSFNSLQLLSHSL
jgi:hypothetical protein